MQMVCTRMCGRGLIQVEVGSPLHEWKLVLDDKYSNQCVVPGLRPDTDYEFVSRARRRPELKGLYVVYVAVGFNTMHVCMCRANLRRCKTYIWH